MNGWRKTLVAGLAAVALGVIVGPAAEAGEVQRHSGTVVAREGGLVQLAEIGPWKVRQGETVIIYRSIEMTPATTLTMVRRDEEPLSGFPGDWVEEGLEPWDLLEGDFVTVDCLHEGGRLIALKITVVAPEEP